VTDPGGGASVPAAIAAVFRDEVAHVVAGLVRRIGDFDLAEDAVQDALLAALSAWQRDGIPDAPRAWLRTAAYNRAVDRLRREARGREKLALLAIDAPPSVESDDRMRLLFTCCHPALAREAQIALTLRAVAGLTTPEIARAFLVVETTMAQRITRAKRKIVEAGIPWRIPDADQLDARVEDVLTVLYLVFNEGHLTTGGAPARPQLAGDAIWLTRLVGSLLPRHAEVMGLLALMLLHRARDGARLDAVGRIVLLQDQDRSRWDRAQIAAASQLLDAARRMGRPGRFWIEAAIAACHCEAPSWEETDWAQVLALYGALQRVHPSPVVRLNRAVALLHVAGPSAALEEVERLAPELDGYHLYHATRAELLRRFGRHGEARDADARALQLTRNPAERTLLADRLAGCDR
jgi:RNA polymerase sigma-70 factor (ECF subfamily)